jgi:hypothetical protein
VSTVEKQTIQGPKPDNTMAKRKTENTMAKRKTDNTMAKNRQYNGQQETKDKRTNNDLQKHYIETKGK